MNMESLVEPKANPDIPALTSGDTVKVSTRVVEGDKERIQLFQGVIIKVRNRGAGSSFTVRRVTYGVGVERTFPLYSPRVEKVEIVRRGKKRRAKLYYLRGLSAKTSRLKEKRLTALEMEREKEEALRKKQELEREREEAKAQQLAQEQESEQEEAPAEEPEAVVEPEAAEAPAEEPEAAVEPEAAEAPAEEPEAALETETAEAPAEEPEAAVEQETEETPAEEPEAAVEQATEEVSEPVTEQEPEQEEPKPEQEPAEESEPEEPEKQD